MHILKTVTVKIIYTNNVFSSYISASKQTKKRNYLQINKRPLSCTFKQVLKKKTQLHLEKGELGRGSETRQKEKVIMSTEKEQRSTHISKMQPSLYS